MVRVCAMYSPYQPAILPRSSVLDHHEFPGLLVEAGWRPAAASMILSMESSDTGSGLKRRMLRVLLTMSMKRRSPCEASWPRPVRRLTAPASGQLERAVAHARVAAPVEVVPLGRRVGHARRERLAQRLQVRGLLGCMTNGSALWRLLALSHWLLGDLVALAQQQVPLEVDPLLERLEHVLVAGQRQVGEAALALQPLAQRLLVPRPVGEAVHAVVDLEERPVAGVGGEPHEVDALVVVGAPAARAGGEHVEERGALDLQRLGCLVRSGPAGRAARTGPRRAGGAPP